MIEDARFKSGGGSRELHETKLTAQSFDENVYSRMNVSLVMRAQAPRGNFDVIEVFY